MPHKALSESYRMMPISYGSWQFQQQKLLFFSFVLIPSRFQDMNADVAIIGKNYLILSFDWYITQGLTPPQSAPADV